MATASGLVFGCHAQLHRLSAGAAGARDGGGAANSARCASCRSSIAQDWLTTKLEATGQKQADWRTDPARSGAAGCVGDIGTHAFNLAEFVTGLRCEQLAADLTTFVPGRALDDNAGMLLRFAGGARGMLWSSQVAPGNENALRLRVYGEKAGPGMGAGAAERAAVHAARRAAAADPPRRRRRQRRSPPMPAAFRPAIRRAIWRRSRSSIATWPNRSRAHRAGREPDPASLLVPGIEDGVRGMRFITAAVASSHDGARWTKIEP